MLENGGAGDGGAVIWFLPKRGIVAGGITDVMEYIAFKENLNASKPSEHPPSGGKMTEGLGGNIGCRDKTSSWYQTGFPM